MIISDNSPITPPPPFLPHSPLLFLPHSLLSIRRLHSSQSCQLLPVQRFTFILVAAITNGSCRGINRCPPPPPSLHYHLLSFLRCIVSIRRRFSLILRFRLLNLNSNNKNQGLSKPPFLTTDCPSPVAFLFFVPSESARGSCNDPQLPYPSSTVMSRPYLVALHLLV